MKQFRIIPVLQGITVAFSSILLPVKHIYLCHMNDMLEVPGGCKTSKLFPNNHKISIYWNFIAITAIISGFVGLLHVYIITPAASFLGFSNGMALFIYFLIMFLFPLLFLFHIHLRAFIGLILTIAAFLLTVVIAADSGGGLSFLLYLNSAMNFALVVKFTELEDENFKSMVKKNPP